MRLFLYNRTSLHAHLLFGPSHMIRDPSDRFGKGCPDKFMLLNNDCGQYYPNVEVIYS